MNRTTQRFDGWLDVIMLPNRNTPTGDQHIALMDGLIHPLRGVLQFIRNYGKHAGVRTSLDEQGLQ